MHKSNIARPQQMTPDELIEREKALLYKEQECKRMTSELQERMLCLSRKENNAEREAQTMLAQLEEYFTCTL